jgi:predicted RNase H-like HicB family nuclease
MRLRVEYTWDHEAGSWVFVVPALHIVGGGPTREAAERHAMEAVLLALEAASEEVDPSAQVGHLEVSVRAPSPAEELPA